jgi:hypothetical protein
MGTKIKRVTSRWCNRHHARRARLRIMWADGRAVWYSCGKPCLVAWKKQLGRWACVTEVSTLRVRV